MSASKVSKEKVRTHCHRNKLDWISNEFQAFASVFQDPCALESMQSMKCLEENDYNRNLCMAQFANYRACKKFWGEVYSARKRAGIQPHMTPIEDRAAMKALYAKTGKIPVTPDG